jgi:NOL1/NOP2/fmu family ribosome biogenesis protein
MNEEKQVITYFSSAFGFDLENILGKYCLRLVARQEKLFVFPAPILDQFASLPLESAGLTLAENSPEGWIPAHDWVSRFGNLFTKNNVALDADTASHWLHGEDLFNFSLAGIEKGQVLIVTDQNSLVLGRGKVLKDRLKNLLPRRLVG